MSLFLEYPVVKSFVENVSSRRLGTLFLGLILLSGCVFSRSEPEGPRKSFDPETSRKIHLGRIVYQQYCTNCHDTDGDGRRFMWGSNLRKIADELSPARVRRKLETGGKRMPSFATQLSESQKEAVTDYLLLELLVEER